MTIACKQIMTVIGLKLHQTKRLEKLMCTNSCKQNLQAIALNLYQTKHLEKIGVGELMQTGTDDSGCQSTSNEMLMDFTPEDYTS